ncbi:uncharacterized protein METZ01_LOCUS112474, partial [marine metagenome]
LYSIYLWFDDNISCNNLCYYSKKENL